MIFIYQLGSLRAKKQMVEASIQQNTIKQESHLFRPIETKSLDRSFVNWEHLKQSLRHFEGPVRKQVYHDTTNHHFKSIGLHHILEQGEDAKYQDGISDQEIELLLEKDLQRCLLDCREWLGDKFDSFDPIRREALLHLRFGLGFQELNSESYNQFKSFLQRFEFSKAAEELNSLPLVQKWNQERIRFLQNAFQDGLF